MTAGQGVADRRRLDMFRTVAAERLTRLNLGWIQMEQGQADQGLPSELLRELHTLKGEGGLMGFAAVVSVCHRLEDILRSVIPEGRIDASTGDVILQGFDLLGALTASEDPTGADVAGVLPFLDGGKSESTTELPPKSGSPPGPTASPPASPPASHPGSPPERAGALAAESSVRITAARLDRMREIVGELILTRARLDLSAKEFQRARQTTVEYQARIAASNPEAGRLFGGLLQTISGIAVRLRDDRYRVSNLVSELDGVVRELRLVPLEALLRTYPVSVRALARELGREVRLEFDGEAVEVDRAVLDRLADPLLHLIRNAVDHGIEPPEVRVRAGKRKEGTILLRARLAGQKLDVEVCDDGGGIDVEVVRARAVELGFCDPVGAKTLTEEQVLRTLFQSGMSTRREITHISGRGIGLDVVLRSIEGLGGSVSVRTVLGQTTSIQLSVPVSSALASMVLFEVRTGRYALPAATVVAIVDATAYPTLDGIDGEAIRYEGMLVPLLSLDALLGETQGSLLPSATEQASSQRLMVVRSGRGLVALCGASRHIQREVVQKTTGKVFAQNRLITAAIPLEDGTLSLVLSPSELLPAATTHRSRREPRISAKAEPSAASRSGRTVLVVDDSPVVRDLLAEALRAHGVRVIEASDGEEALARLDDSPEITLLVSDVDMPKLDGIALVQRVRSRGGPRRLPVVIVSMRGSAEDQRRAIDAGADAYLVKTDLTHSGLWALLVRFLG